MKNKANKKRKINYAPPRDDTLVIAISSRALFDLTESHEVFETQGLDAYEKYQIAHENEPLAPGVAFSMVQKFLRLNEAGETVAIVLISRNTANTGLRIFNSIDHYGLDITRAAFTAGAPTHEYAKSFNAGLFLSLDDDDVRNALQAGIAAANIYGGGSGGGGGASAQLKIAFDADAVLFSDEAERVFVRDGIQAFTDTEKDSAERPLSGGPFKNFLAALHNIQKTHAADESPIRTALITARAAPTHKRVIKTLRDWQIRIDESFFLGGMDKGPFLRAFDADIFFDDQKRHCDSARRHVATGHVPHGVMNVEGGSRS